MKHSYTEQQLRVAITNARSIRQALLNLNLKGEGGNYRVIHKAVAKYNIDISHFKHQGWSKNLVIGPKRDIKDYLEKGVPITSHKLRLRLLKEQIFEHRCSSCYLTFWLDGPIPLQLDHKDGNHLNNNLSNLRLLCPNCHSLTSTFAGKNKGKGVYA